ncbi:MAG: hypothetical protein J7L88_00870 [Thermoplasmata archaeon]|nr:hypothetical protein [Thermoplasmata archaeon]
MHLRYSPWVLAGVFLALLLLLTTYLNPHQIRNYPAFLDLHTLSLLTGLLLVTGGLERSGYFQRVSNRLLTHIRSERALALSLVLLSALLSTFLTNDAALFVVVPITAALGRCIKNDVKRLVVFEALAVNAGSSLTPIGNPQNIYIWHRWGISFVEFTLQMAPLTALLVSLLLLISFLSFPDKRIELRENVEGVVDKKLLHASAGMLLLLVILSELFTPLLPLLFILPIYALLRRDVIKKADWYLIALFALIFLTFSSLSHLPGVEGAIRGWVESKAGLYLTSILLSQAISNVPATVLLAHHSSSYRILAYGVNVGGAGFITASLANLIALRLYGSKGVPLEFLKWSIPYLLISALTVGILL